VNVYCGTEERGVEGRRESFGPDAISAYSRYARQVIYYPDPSNTETFERHIVHVSRKLGFRVIIPVAQRATITLSKGKERLKQFIIPVADYKSLSIGASKKQTIQLAEDLKIPTPNTTTIASSSDLHKHTFKFPLVVKGVFGRGLVNYVRNNQELKKSVATLYELQGEYPLVQEYIQGPGYGFFALFNKGSPRAIFMHRRIRELPSTGGMSTCAESVYEP